MNVVLPSVVVGPVPTGEPHKAGTLVEVTCRTIHGRYLLRPSDELNEIVIGVQGYAQQSCPISICELSSLRSRTTEGWQGQGSGEFIRVLMVA